MAYAIMRFAKLKTNGAISTAQKHNDRERETLNANQEIENIIVHGDKNKSYVESFNEITKDIKIRKNAVLAIECFMSVSPEANFLKDHEKILEWSKNSIEWLKEKFGEENIIKSHLHLDEMTPHLHTFIIPVVREKNKKQLSSYSFLGGSRTKLSDWQTEYYNKVKKFNLERGIKGSQATHKSTREFYTFVNEVKNAELPEPKRFESVKAYKKRATKHYKSVYAKYKYLQLKLDTLEGQLKAKVERNKDEEIMLNEIKELKKDNLLYNFIKEKISPDEEKTKPIKKKSIKQRIENTKLNQEYKKSKNKDIDRER